MIGAQAGLRGGLTELEVVGQEMGNLGRDPVREGAISTFQAGKSQTLKVGEDENEFGGDIVAVGRVEEEFLDGERGDVGRREEAVGQGIVFEAGPCLTPTITLLTNTGTKLGFGDEDESQEA